MSEPRKHSYGQILKSSAFIGGSSVLNVGFGIVRNKALALILGPTGVGLLGLYVSIYDLTRSFSGLGIANSGVRQIAEAVATGDGRRIARTVITLRRVALLSGAIGALLLVAVSFPISWFTFGDYRHAGWVALLALAVWFNTISTGQGALVQGVRRISDLARMSVLGGFYGTIFSIPIIYFYGENGIVPFLLCGTAMSILTSWWYARKVAIEKVPMSFRDILAEASSLLRLGLVFMASGLMTMGVAYLVRVMVLRWLSLEAAGCFQAAWTLSYLYVNFIMQAMGADFFPRLTAVANDNSECNRLVNEQAEVGLLLAAPGLLGTLTFAPLVLQVFYSAKFWPAADVLCWICLGMALRVACWPMGFILVARGERKLFFWMEFLSSALQLGLVWCGLALFGLNGTGIAVFALNVCNLVCVYWLVRHLTGYRWSPANGRLALVFVPLVALVFAGRFWLPHPAAIALGTLLTVAAGLYSVKTVCTLVPMERFPGFARKTLWFFRLAPRPSAD